MADLVFLDWGSARLRAWRVDRHGAILERRESERGILAVPDAAFVEALVAEIGDWVRAGTRILASGMITSRQGWVETGYVDCPATLDALGGSVVRRHVELNATGAVEIAFTPGLRTATPPFDVMRGEEIQLLGLGADGLVVLPGTHSKWAQVKAGAVARFATFLTGEFHAVLLAHSIIGRLATPDATPDSEAFAEGLAAGARAHEEGGLARAVFAARTLVLAGRLEPDGVTSFLSGLLIGSEIAQGRLLFGEEAPTIVASPSLTDAYALGFAAFGVEPRRAPPDIAARGLSKIASSIGWLDAESA
ncbi:2-dehydro-3-deoxygalactonokinase [Salinarimonas sp.]|uniref:2-dehydro-3-deoxygalactonokinase n=1 Tax=Salinarimonas sp. TaxID=2766526 RepID=UPI00391C04F4